MSPVSASNSFMAFLVKRAHLERGRIFLSG